MAVERDRTRDEPPDWLEMGRSEGCKILQPNMMTTGDADELKFGRLFLGAASGVKLESCETKASEMVSGQTTGDERDEEEYRRGRF
jgi:hypothetical protein